MEVTQGRRAVERLLQNVYFNDSVVPTIGAAVCFDRTRSAFDERNFYVTKPTLANILDCAGVIVETGNERSTGPSQLQIARVDEGVCRGVSVRTDESVTAGDFLGPIPGSYYWGKAILGPVVFRATETIDGSATPALVRGDLGPAAYFGSDLLARTINFFDHFSDGSCSATAGAARYTLFGTSAAMAYQTSRYAEQATANLRASGVLRLTSNTTNNAGISVSGEPFGCPVGSSIFARCRLAISTAIAANFSACFGLGLTDTANVTTTALAVNDFVGFASLSGAAWEIAYQKGASGLVELTTGVTPVINQFTELAFMMRNKATGTGAANKELVFWQDGVLVAQTPTLTEFSDDQSFTTILDCIGSSANTLDIDRLEVRQYIS